MKRAIALFLALALMGAVLAVPAAAADTQTVDAVSMVRALGILTGDASGNLNLTNNVTRAEFCKMLVAASSYKDTVGGSSGYSLFKDVKSSHWAVEYIKVCVDSSWFIGYADGTFHPDDPITLEQAATVALRLLGYTSDDLAGSYPTAQLSKFNALGLHDGFPAQKGQYMTRSDCVQLFYNLMAASTKDGTAYATTLGYTLDSTGHVDYASLVAASTKGPYTLEGGTIAGSLPFTASNVTVYYNGAAATLSAAGDYDIYYYNADLRTVWIYSNRVTGTYSAASPSTAAPTSVTVAGVSYTIETSGAAYKLSTQGSYALGDQVTLLLGMNGGVADVCSTSAVTGTYYGIVTGSTSQSVTSAGNTVTVSNTVKVACTDGVERTFETGTSTFTDKALVKIDYSDSSRPVSRQSTVSTSGKVNAAATKLGDLNFADDVEILDTDSYGGYVKIFPSRLAGATLASSNVLFYSLDTSGDIDRLILRDATGDTADYGILTVATGTIAGTTSTGSYAVLIGGSETKLSTSTVFSVDKGPAIIYYEDGSVSNMRNLTKLTLSSIGATSAVSGNKTYPLSEDCQIYIEDDDDNYFSANLTTVSDTAKYTVLGYYDSFGYPAGGRIRVMVATEK